MKILYSRTNFWFDLRAGGSVGHTIGVLQSFAQMGKVEVISNESIYGAENIPCEIVKPIGKSWGWPGELLYNVYFAPRLTAKIRKFQPDFVYHRYNGDSIATAFVCKRLRMPLVLEFNSSMLWKLRYWDRGTRLISRLSTSLRKPILSFAEPFNLRSATLIVVVSEQLKNSLVLKGLSPNLILVNPNGVNPEKFKTSSDDICSRIKQELGIPPGVIVAGFSGTFGEWHGLAELAEAITVMNADPKWSNRLFFVLYGNGKLQPMIHKKIGHFDNVRFTGIVEYEHIQDYMSVCDILISPHGIPPDGRAFFGSPTKLFEYMAMEKPIVASDLDQIGEVLKHDETAWMVKPGDVESLMFGLKVLIDDEERRNRLGRAARREVVEKYTWKEHTQKIIQKLKESCK